MLGNKELHYRLWNYIIKYVRDEGFLDTDAEDFLIDIKLKFFNQYLQKYVTNLCYACEECGEDCIFCPIASKTGMCSDEDSSYISLLKAIREKDSKTFIKVAEEIRDAWT